VEGVDGWDGVTGDLRRGDEFGCFFHDGFTD
jgi:hypothetical protein